MTILGLEPAERFWAKFVRVDGCWLWTASVKNRHGYGQFWWNGRDHYAHRAVYQILVGPIPEGCELDHLEPVSHRENIQRAHGDECRRGPAERLAGVPCLSGCAG